MKNSLWIVFFFLPVLILLGEGRSKNLDFIVLLDKSLSMDTKISDVKSFFKEKVLEKSVIPGDRVVLIAFYGKTEVLANLLVQGTDELKGLESQVDAIKANGRYTDIGNALDFTYDFIKELPATENRKHFILLTDGRQEAPPGSKYQSTDFSIKHPFLESAKNIQEAGWKVQILGIGTDTEAANLADELSGVSEIWKDAHSLLLDRHWDAQEELDVVSQPKLSFLDGKSRLDFQVEAHDLTQGSSLVVKQIYLMKEDGSQPLALLDSPFPAELTPRMTEISIPIQKTISPFTLEKGVFLLQFGGTLPLSLGRFQASSGWFFLDKSWVLYPCLFLLVTLASSAWFLRRRWKSFFFRLANAAALQKNREIPRVG